MPAPTAPLRFTEQGRSGTRMLMAMPVTSNGGAHAGKVFEEKTRTVVINRTGCKLVTEQQLVAGSQMTISIANSKRAASVTVVWVGEKKGKLLEVGIDFDKPDPGFWGVMFPEDTPTTSESKPVPAAAKPQSPATTSMPTVALPIPPKPAA